MDNQSTNKWNIRLTAVSVLAAIIATLTAIYGNIQSQRAIDIANEANRLLNEEINVMLPNIVIEPIQGIVPNIAFFEATPCQPILQDEVMWQVRFVRSFMLTNRGGMPTALLNIEQPIPDIAAEDTRKYPLDIRAGYSLFESEEDFIAWYTSNIDKITASGFRELAIQETFSELDSYYLFSEMPITIDTGETVFLLLSGAQSITINAGDYPYPPRDTDFRYGGNWGSSVEFTFNDGTTSSLLTYTYPFHIDESIYYRQLGITVECPEG